METDTRRSIPFAKFLTKIFKHFTMPITSAKTFPPFTSQERLERKGLKIYKEK